MMNHHRLPSEGDRMKAGYRRTMLLCASAVLVSQAGCLTPFDVQSIAQGQLIAFVNALINTVTSDAIRVAIGG